MDTALKELPDDVASLKKLLLEQARRAHDLEQENSALKLSLEKLQGEYEVLRRKFFGASSERRKKEEESLQQGWLFNEAETYAEAPGVPAKKVPVAAHERKARGRKALPENLERREIVHALTEQERTCPACGEVRPEIGQEVREEL
jgi:predicted nuclease with TOPRIM domain